MNNTILSDQLLIDILVKGIVDAREIRLFLDNAPYFMPKGAEPPWRVVWNALERTDDEFRNALAKMETQFVSRQFIAPSELLHVFGLRLWLSDLGILDQSRDQLVAEGRRYIDDLYDRKCSEAWSDEAFDQLSFGYGGLGVREADKKDFRELSDYLMERRKDLTERSYPEKGARLLAEIEADSQLFFRRVNITNSENNIYACILILSSIGSKAFVFSFLRQHLRTQRIIMMALKTRYEGGALQGKLAPEKAWLNEVHCELKAGLSDASKIAQWRVKLFTDWMAPVLQDIEPS